MDAAKLEDLFRESILSTARSINFCLGELWCSRSGEKNLAFRTAEAFDEKLKQRWISDYKGCLVSEGKGMAGRVHRQKTLEWCIDVTMADEVLVPRAKKASMEGFRSCLGFPGTFGRVHYVIILFSKERLQYSDDYVSAAGKMIQDWEESFTMNQGSRISWTAMARKRIMKIVKSFNSVFATMQWMDKFEGIELWILDGGTLHNAETLSISELNKWKEGNQFVTFEPGEGLVGRVCEVKSTECLVEQQLLCTLKFKRALLAQQCGVKTIIGVTVRFREFDESFEGLRGVLCVFSRESIAIDKTLFEAVEDYVVKWQRKYIGKARNRGKKLLSLPMTELIPRNKAPREIQRYPMHSRPKAHVMTSPMVMHPMMYASRKSPENRWGVEPPTDQFSLAQSSDKKSSVSSTTTTVGVKRKAPPTAGDFNHPLDALAAEAEAQMSKDAEDLAKRTNNISKDLEFLLFRGPRGRGKRVHQCQYCGKTFPKKGNWRAHLRVHTQEKPFVCDLCGKGFSQKSNMKRHKKSHENQQARAAQVSLQ